MYQLSLLRPSIPLRSSAAVLGREGFSAPYRRTVIEEIDTNPKPCIMVIQRTLKDILDRVAERWTLFY